MAETTSTLSPPPFREGLCLPQPPLREPLLLSATWSRWIEQLYRRSGVPGPVGPAGPEGPQGIQGPQGEPGTPATLGPTLTTIEALTGTLNTLLYFTGTDVAALTPLTAFARTLLDDADQGAMRGTLGLGTMSVQNANAVAITGGTAQLSNLGLGTPATSNALQVVGASVLGYLNTLGLFEASAGINALHRNTDNIAAFWTNQNTGTGRYAVQCVGTAPASFGGTLHCADLVGIRTAPNAVYTCNLLYARASANGLGVQPSADTGPGAAISFQNAAGTNVGSITTTSSATAYNTASDRRLKHAIAPLTAALERVRALRPVAFRWNSTDEQDEGFLAHELQQVAPRAVTGQPEELNDDGSIRPQQVDSSKLMALAIAGMKEALAQIDALTARITTLEQALGA
jgi:hypothetical protein